MTAKIRRTNYILQYNRMIQSGKIPACEKIKAIYSELAEDCKKKHPYHFDLDLAMRPITFVETFCKQSKGSTGAPIKLELFQKAGIQAIFGFVDDKGVRRFNEVLWIMGRKNGKSVLTSALGLYMMIGDHEGGAEVDCVASKRSGAHRI